MQDSPDTAAPRNRIRHYAGWVCWLLTWCFATVYILHHTHGITARQHYASSQFAPPPNSAQLVEGRNLILPSFAVDGYAWIRYAQEMSDRGAWRLRHVTLDNPPEGRELHWNSGFCWWLITLGKCHSLATGTSLRASIEVMAGWANPLLLIGCLLVFGAMIRAKFGVFPAIWTTCAAAGSALYYESFFPCYPDHHGMINAAIVGMALCLAISGAGWTSLPRGMSHRHRQYWVMLSGLFGGIALWASAVTMTIVLLCLGVAALATLSLGGLQAKRQDPNGEPELWKLWGYSGCASSLFFYGLEYFPNHLSWRLEANHPLYSLAWLGGGLLLEMMANWHIHARRDQIGRWAIALVCLAALPVTIALGGSSVYVMRDPFFTGLLEHIIECLPIWIRVQQSGITPFLHLIGLAPLPMLLLAWAAFYKKTPLRIRRLCLLFLGLAAALTLAFALQTRWSLVAAAAWLCCCVPAGIWISDSLSPVWLRNCLAVFVVATTLATPVSYLQRIEAVTRQKNISQDEGLMLALRDIAHFIRAEGGGKAVFLSNPTCSTPLGYFSDLTSVCSLFWENMPGLKKAAAIHSATSDAEALALLKNSATTHIAFISYEHFIQQFFDLAKPTEPSQHLAQTFGAKVFFGRELPDWLRPLPYSIPPGLRDLKWDVLVCAVEPGQERGDALFYQGDYLASHELWQEAASKWNQACHLMPEQPLIWMRLAEAKVHTGDTQEAVPLFHKTLRLLPEPARAQAAFQIATLLLNTRHKQQALVFYRQAADLGVGDAQNNAAWIMATAPWSSTQEHREALERIQKSSNNNPENPAFLDTLSASLARLGKYTEAIETAHRAADLCRKGQFEEGARAIELRASHYANRKPWIEE